MRTTNKDLENKLYQLFTNHQENENAGFIKTAGDRLEVKETEDSGKFKIIFHAHQGHMIQFETSKIKDLSSGIFKHREENVLQSCDGIFLFMQEETLTLCLVELKKTIKKKTFFKAIDQIEDSYLSVSMLLNLLTDIEDISLKVFIGGSLGKKSPDVPILAKMGEYRGNRNMREAKLYQLMQEGRTRRDFPCSVSDVILPMYFKKNVEVIHIEPETEFVLG